MSKLDEKIINPYVNYLKLKGYSFNKILKKINNIKLFLNWEKNRRTKEVKKYHNFFKKQNQDTKDIIPNQKINQQNILYEPIFQNTIYKILTIKNLFQYISFVFISIFIVFLTLSLYERFFQKVKRPFAYGPKILKTGRIISYKGQLLDSLGNPITTKTDVVFKLYNVPTGGNPLYTGSCAGVNGITPNQDGFFEILIGQDCGMRKIPSNIFFENPDIYLGITVGTDAEMLPRQRIPNVGYAINTETLQGLTPDTGKEKTAFIPFINKNGDLLLTLTSPAIRSTLTSANFEISSANNLTITSGLTGDIVLQSTGSGELKFKTGGNSNAYIRMIIDNLGRIGIGTTQPEYNLEVSGTGRFTSTLYTDGEISTTIGGLSLDSFSGTTTINDNLVVTENSDFQGTLSNSKGALILADDVYIKNNQLRLGNFSSPPPSIGNGSLYYNTTNNKVYYYSGKKWVELGNYWQKNTNVLSPSTLTESVVIGGKTTTNFLFEVSGKKNNNALVVFNETGDQNILVASASGKPKFVITHSGNIGINTTNPKYKLQIGTAGDGSSAIANSWNTFSDIRWKTKVQTINNALELIKKLRGVKFQWKNSLKPDIGFIAQEVEKILPEIVSTDKNGYKSIEYGRITSLLVEAIKQQQAQIEKLTKSINKEFQSTIIKTQNLTTKTLNITSENIKITGQTFKEYIQTIVNKTLDKKLTENTITPVDLQEIQSQISSLKSTTENLKLKLEKITSREATLAKSKIQSSKSKKIFPIKINIATQKNFKVKNLNIKPSKKGKLAKLILEKYDKTKTIILDSEGNASISGQLKAYIANLEKLKTKEATIEGKLVAKEIEAENISSLAATITNQNSRVKNLENKIKKIKEKLKEITNNKQQLASNEASFTITKKNSKINTISQQSSTKDNQINQTQKLLAEIKNEPLPDVRYYQKLPKDINIIVKNTPKMTFNNSSNVNNSVSEIPNIDKTPPNTNYQLPATDNLTFYSASVINTLSVGLLSIDNDRILSLSWELKLSALEKINFFDGEIVIAKDGTITTEGQIIAKGGLKTNEISPISEGEDLTVKLASKPKIRNSTFKIENQSGQEVASINASGSAYFKELILDKYLQATSPAAIIAADKNFKETGQYAPAIKTNNEIAGVGRLPAGESEVIIYNEKSHKTSLILITPTTPGFDGNLTVVEKADGLFKIVTSKKQNKDITFDWLIIN